MLWLSMRLVRCAMGVTPPDARTGTKSSHHVRGKQHLSQGRMLLIVSLASLQRTDSKFTFLGWHF